jgi:hypothetical protein
VVRYINSTYSLSAITGAQLLKNQQEQLHIQRQLLDLQQEEEGKGTCPSVKITGIIVASAGKSFITFASWS